jgi:hypothetical protein
MRILSIFFICLLPMQGAMFAAPRCVTAKDAICSCCKGSAHKCCCCPAEVPKNDKKVPLRTSPCACSFPVLPLRHETAAFISENSGFNPIRIISAMPAVMTWQGFNYLRTSIAATSPPIRYGSPPLSFPLRI